jgi:hypothetical protein
MNGNADFALVPRARKVAALIEFMDFTVESMGVNPFLHATQVAEAISRLSADDWKMIAKRCGQRKPSDITIGQIVESYMKRAGVLKEAS